MHDSSTPDGNSSRPARKPRKRLLVFNDPRPLRIDRGLAQEIGFLESLILLQLEYHISTTNNLRDGQYWTYQTLKDLRDRDFQWLSTATISRTLKSLEDMGLLNVGNYNKSGMDRTQWFALNYEGIANLKSISVGDEAPILQNENWDLQKEKSMLQNEKRMLQNEAPILQCETTIPKYSPNENTNKNPKDPEVFAPLVSEQKEELPFGISEEQRQINREGARKLKEQMRALDIARLQKEGLEKGGEGKG